MYNSTDKRCNGSSHSPFGRINPPLRVYLLNYDTAWNEGVIIWGTFVQKIMHLTIVVKYYNSVFEIKNFIDI